LFLVAGRRIRTAIGESGRGVFGLPGSGFDLRPESWGLPSRFPGEVFLLCVSQHLGQLGIPAVIGEDEHHRCIRRVVV
jgi:hypothetical protein